MKNLISLLFCIFIASSCASQKKAAINTAVIEYTANTRGFYQKITVQKQKVAISKDRSNTEKPVEIAISKKDWEALTAYFKSVKLDSLATYKAPTVKRFHDGAAIANLKITYKDKTYETTSFDHGFPPTEIKEFVDKINLFAKK